MQRISLAIAVLLALGAFAASPGCNTAELHEPPDVDSGSGLCDAAPAIGCAASDDDAGVTCAADPTSSDPSVSKLPPGTSYAVGCKIATQAIDALGCATQSQCTCIRVDGSAAGEWSCVK